jgi:hypothetical protein
MNSTDRLFLADCLVKTALDFRDLQKHIPDKLNPNKGSSNWPFEQSFNADITGAYGRMTPLQKILMGSIIGGGVGGIERAMSPRMEDKANDRGVLNRLLRGGVRGAATGAGGMGGVAGMEQLGGKYGILPGPLGQLAGMGGGAFAGNRLSRMLME